MICIVLVVLLFTMAHVSKTGRHIYRIKDGKTASFEDMVKEISSAQVIFVGEQHDNPAHHKTQLDVIQALHEYKKPLAIGMENSVASIGCGRIIYWDKSPHGPLSWLGEFWSPLSPVSFPLSRNLGPKHITPKAVGGLVPSAILSSTKQTGPWITLL